MNQITGKKDYLLIISFFTTILLSGALQVFNIFYLAALNIIVLFIMYNKIRFTFSIETRRISILIIVYFSYSFFISISTESFTHIFFRLSDFLTALLLINYIIIKKKSFEKEVVFVFKIILFYGLISFLFSLFFFDLYVPVVQLTGDYEKLGTSRFLIFFARNESYMGIHRSQAIFWEPGVYQIYLNFMLFYCLFKKKKKNYLLTFIISVSILLTLSTTGIVIATIILSFYFYKESKKSLKFIVLIIFFSPIIFYYLNFTQVILKDKIDGDRIGSYEARKFDALNSLYVLVDNPLGIGFDPYTYQLKAKNNIYNIKSFLQTDRSSTNGILILFVSTGIFFGIFFIYLLYHQNIFPKHRVLVFTIIIISISSEPLFFSPFFLIFCLSSLAKNNTYLKLNYDKS